jgi:hypothetical protein
MQNKKLAIDNSAASLYSVFFWITIYNRRFFFVHVFLTIRPEKTIAQ